MRIIQLPGELVNFDVSIEVIAIRALEELSAWFKVALEKLLPPLLILESHDIASGFPTELLVGSVK